MAKRDSANLVLNVRRDSQQRALQEALLVPWQRLAEGAAAFAEWHMIILWVRVITETADQLPQIVRSALQSRCPGFLESRSREQKDDLPIWKSLEEWVTAHAFASARAEGWFDALMYYAYKDLRTEQAWTTWERTKADWRQTAPVRWPTLEQWTSEVLATRSLACPATEKARTVHALGAVEACYVEKNEHTGEGGGPIAFTGLEKLNDEQLDAVIKKLKDSVGQGADGKGQESSAGAPELRPSAPETAGS